MSRGNNIYHCRNCGSIAQKDKATFGFKDGMKLEFTCKECWTKNVLMVKIDTKK